MWIKGENLNVKSDEGDILFEDISFSFETGEFVLIATDDAQKAVAFSMLASGRLRKYGGVLSIVTDEGKERARLFGLRDIRAVTAVPFVPGIGEPDEFLKAWRVLKEEFLFAGQKVSRSFILDYLAETMGDESDGAAEGGDDVTAGAGAGKPASLRIKDLKHTSRIKLFTELAAMRPHVRFIFVTLPDRYGGLPQEWLGKIKESQTEDNAVILITSKTVAELLREHYQERYYDLDRGMKLCGDGGAS
jgi:hypothetical protein